MKTQTQVLIFWEGDGGGATDISLVAVSRSMKRLKNYKKELEEKSAAIRKKLGEIESEREKATDPIFVEIRKARKAKDFETIQKLQTELSLVNSEFYGKRDEVIDSAEIEYWIDDEELAGYEIADVREI